MRLSEAERNALTLYAEEKGVRLDLTYYCNSREEVDAMDMCQTAMECESREYNHHRSPYMKNRDRNKRHLEKALAKCTTTEEELREISHMQQVEPLEPQAQSLKDDARATVTKILRDAGIGKKRILKMLPTLMMVLQEGEEPLTEEEIQAYNITLQKENN